MNKSLRFSGILVLLVFFINSAYKNIQDNWPVPAEYKKMKNPYANKKDIEKTGKSLWNQHCKSCHGNKGLGDGKKMANLDISISDFSMSKFKSQTDGEIYYKMIKGRGIMPKFEKKIPYKSDRWYLVNYLRTF